MSWTVSGTSTWLNLTPSSGTIASGTSATVSATINSNANLLGAGSYSDNMSFANTTNGMGNTTLPAALTVTLPPPVITSPLTATGTSGVAFSYTIAASNNPTSYNATGLPLGLSVNAATAVISGTPTATGTSSNVTISAVNVSGSGNASLIITIQTSFAAWKNLWFTEGQLGDVTVSGDMATPAGDGVPNLLKYALDLNPMANGVSGLPVGAVMAIGGTNYLTLTYTQDIFAADITYVPEVSGDLQTWNSGLGYVAPVSVTNNGDGVTETIIVQDLTPMGSAPRFIRLRVTRP